MSNDYKKDELINVMLPRKDFETLQRILERETAYNWFVNKLKSYWVWAISGGVLTFWMLYDKIVEATK